MRESGGWSGRPDRPPALGTRVRAERFVTQLAAALYMRQNQRSS